MTEVFNNSMDQEGFTSFPEMVYHVYVPEEPQNQYKRRGDNAH